jgi:hypothetical protein
MGYNDACCGFPLFIKARHSHKNPLASVQVNSFIHGDGLRGMPCFHGLFPSDLVPAIWATSSGGAIAGSVCSKLE